MSDEIDRLRCRSAGRLLNVLLVLIDADAQAGMGGQAR